MPNDFKMNSNQPPKFITMTQPGNFRRAKKVLIFDEKRVFVGVLKSLHITSQFSRINSQAISLCCTGQRVSINGYYFRHSDPSIKVDVDDDLDILTLEEYDKLCGAERKYHPVHDMKDRRIKAGRTNPKKKNKKPSKK